MQLHAIEAFFNVISNNMCICDSYAPADLFRIKINSEVLLNVFVGTF